MSLEALAHALTAHATSREALEDVLAVLVLSLPPEQRDVDDEVTLLLGRFAQRAGALDAAVSPDGAQAAIARYLDAHPLDGALLEAVSRVAREQLASGAASSLAKNAARVTGAAEGKGVLGGGERPAGTTAAGPLARFLVTKR